MLNSLRDGQINYGTPPNCPSVHVPPHNVVAPIHQNSSLVPTESAAPVVYPWSSNPRLEHHLYGFHSRYYNFDFAAPSYHPPPTPPPPPLPVTNQYVPANIYGQNVPPPSSSSQCCQPCCRLRSQTAPKMPPSQPLYNPIRPPVQQLNRPYNKLKKTSKSPCSAEQFLPYIPNESSSVKYDAQNCYQQKYGGPSYLNNANYCPPANNLWIPPAANSTWSADSRLRPPAIGRHAGVVTHDYGRDTKNYHQRLPNYQTGNPYTNPVTGVTHRPYNYIPPPAVPDVHDYHHRPPVYHNQFKNNASDYVSHEHNSRLLPPPISSQANQNSSSLSLQQYYGVQPAPMPLYAADVQTSSGGGGDEPFKSQMASQNAPKSNLNVREFLATWDEGEEEMGEKLSTETTAAPIVVLDCMTLEGDALTKVQEKLNVVSYEHLEKVLKENQGPSVVSAEICDLVHNKMKPPPKPNFEPLDYTKRETGIIKPFISEKRTSSGVNSQSEKSYSVNFDGMVAWYGKKNTDISSTDLIERLADRIFNLSKSQENEGVSFGTASYTGQITQTNHHHRAAIEEGSCAAVKDSSKYVQSQQLFNPQHHHHHHQLGAARVERSGVNKIDCCNDSVPRTHHHSRILNESNKTAAVKSAAHSGVNSSSCIVENVTKKCLDADEGTAAPSWSLDHGSHEQHLLNMSLYDHGVIMKPLDFSSLTDETKGNDPFAFDEKHPTGGGGGGGVKPDDDVSVAGDHRYGRALNENNSYGHPAVSTNGGGPHALQQMGSGNRHYPVIVSPHRQEYGGFHESVIQRTGCDRNNKHGKGPPDFENINWSISNDLDKIMKHTDMTMEPSCLYDRSNYGMLDGSGMNADKTVSSSTQWKDSGGAPCVDLTTVNGKMNNHHHDSFFDGWNFIETYENHSSKKTLTASSNSNNNDNGNDGRVPLFADQMSTLDKNRGNDGGCGENVPKNEPSVVVKDPSFSKPASFPSSNGDPHSRNVFNLNNNRIPDFGDGFELAVINSEEPPHDYAPYKKPDTGRRRADGSIFEHLTEPPSAAKCVRPVCEPSENGKNNEQPANGGKQPDVVVVGLPSFKDKEPLAPMPVPPKLNVVKPIIRDPRPSYTVIKQKSKYDGAENEHAAGASNKTGGDRIPRASQTNIYGGTDLKAKYGGGGGSNVQLSQFDVWSEKFVLKGGPDDHHSSNAVVQCDVEITQFKSTPENRGHASSSATTPPKPPNDVGYPDKTAKLPRTTDCLIADKMDDGKLNSDDFLRCLENAKTNDQKYRDTLDEFETSFGFDMHCNSEPNKSFHENIVDKCLEETINDKIGEMNASDPTNNNNAPTGGGGGNTITSSSSSDNNNGALPFHCNFQSNYLIKNYYDENKNATAVLEKNGGGDFHYGPAVGNEFELTNQKNVRAARNSENRSDFDIIDDINGDVLKRMNNAAGENDSNFIDQTELKRPFEPSNDTAGISRMTGGAKNRFDYLTTTERRRDFAFGIDQKSIRESAADNSEETIASNNRPDINDLSDIQKQSCVNVDFANINSVNIFETDPNAANGKSGVNGANENDDISFEPSFRTGNTANGEQHHVTNRNMFAVGNNNGDDFYRTQNLEKMHGFDFETRIIEHFELRCSDSGNARKAATSPIEIRANNVEKTADYDYRRGDGTEGETQKEPRFDSAVSIGEPSNKDYNGGNARFNNAAETGNKNDKFGNIFEVTEHEELNLATLGRRPPSANRNDDAEVENIFENLFDNLKTLHNDKDSGLFKHRDDDKRVAAPKSLENIGGDDDAILKTDDPSNLRKDGVETTKYRDEAFDETNNVILLQEFVNNSTSRLMSMCSRQCGTSSKEAKPTSSDEFDVSESVKHGPPNETEDYFAGGAKDTAAYENIVATFDERRDAERNETDMINRRNDGRTVTDATIAGTGTTDEMFERTESDASFTVQITDEPADGEFSRRRAGTGSSFGGAERARQERFTAVDDASSSDSSLFESARQRCFNEFSELRDSSGSTITTDTSSPSRRTEFTCRRQDDDVDNDSTSSSSSPGGSTRRERFHATIEYATDFRSTLSNDAGGKDPRDVVEADDEGDSSNSETNAQNRSEHQEDQRRSDEMTSETTEDSTNSSAASSLIGVEFSVQIDRKDTVDDSTGSKSNSPNRRVDTTASHHERLNEIIEEDSTNSSRPVSSNNVEFARERDIGEVYVNSARLLSNLDVGSARRERFFNIETDDSSNSEPTSLLRDVDQFTGQTYSKDVDRVDSSSPEPTPPDRVEPTERLDHIVGAYETGDLCNFPTSDDVEFPFQNDHKRAIDETEDSISSGCVSPNTADTARRGRCNEISIDREPVSPNDVEFTIQKYSESVADVEGDLISSESNSLSDAKAAYQERVNVESTNSGLCSFNEMKFTQDSEGIVEVEDNSCSSNHVERSPCRFNGPIVNAEDSSTSESTSPDDVEFNYYDPNSSGGEDVVEDETAACFPYRVEPTTARREYLNDMIEADHDSCTSESTSSNGVGLNCYEPNTGDAVEIETTACSPYRGQPATTRQEYLNDLIVTNDSNTSESTSSNDVGFNYYEPNSGDAVELEETTACSPYHVEPPTTTRQEYLNDLIITDDSSTSESTSLGDAEIIHERKSGDNVGIENAACPSNGVELPTRRERPNEITDIDEYPIINPVEPITSDDVVEFGPENIVGVERTTPGPVSSLFDRVELTADRPRSDGFVVDFSATGRIALPSTGDQCPVNNGGWTESAVDVRKFPRVKFTLKCRRAESMTNKNVFDEDQPAPCTRRRDDAAIGDAKTLIGRSIFKKRDNGGCREPLRSIREGERRRSSDDDDDDDPKAAALVDNEPASDPGDGAVIDAETTGNVVADHGGRRDDEPQEEVGENDNDGHATTSLDELDGQTPEYGDDVEYWDKSLENEYKNALRKTISRLAKAARVCNIRDKFNTRLLARRTNATRLRKRRRRRRRWRRRRRGVDDEVEDCRAELLDDGKPTAVAVSVVEASTTKRWKIKVQLPWGRIFNLNNRLDGCSGQNKGTISSSSSSSISSCSSSSSSYSSLSGGGRDTKLELGPAKVEVRLSRTPGEWQVAACESVTSSKSVVSVKRLVLQRAASPTRNCDERNNKFATGDCGGDDGASGSGNGDGGGFRKLPKIVIRRNGRDNNYTSYVRCGSDSGGTERFDVSGGGGGDDDDDDENDGCPRLMVRLVRNRKLDAMAADGVTTLHLKHIVPMGAETTTDTHGPKRVRYA